jgi:hypothetical protein
LIEMDAETGWYGVYDFATYIDDCSSLCRQIELVKLTCRGILNMKSNLLSEYSSKKNLDRENFLGILR